VIFTSANDFDPILEQMNTFPTEALDSEDTPQFFKTIKEELKCYIKQFQSDQNNKRINVSFLNRMIGIPNIKLHKNFRTK
jgi:hypothetical protein